MSSTEGEEVNVILFQDAVLSSNKNQANVVIKLVILALKKELISDTLPVFSQCSNKDSKI